MATYAELQTRVQSIVIDLPTAVLNQIPTLVNEAVRELQRRHKFRICEAKTSVFTTTEESETLGSVPTDWMQWRDRPLLIHDTGRVRRLAIANSRQDAEARYGSIAGGEHDIATLVGEPKCVFITEDSTQTGASRSFCVRPIPDGNSLYANGDYRIQIPYWRYLTALSGSSDTNWLTTNGEVFIAYHAASQAFLLDWDEERAAIWAQNAANQLKSVIDADKRERYSAAAGTLTPVHDANDPGIWPEE